MDNEDRKYSLAELEKYSYRVLQQIAKSLCLPSNVKKMYLIQMIHTKKFKSQEELNTIIDSVKRERQQVSQKKKVARKRTYLQGTEISSTSNSLSPPISMTPKRKGHIVIRCSPENIRQAIAKYNARQGHMTHSATAVRKTYPSPKKSDRVLRSFNIKANNTQIVEIPTASTKTTSNSFGSINNSVFSVIRPQNMKEAPQQSMMNKMTAENCMVKRYRPVLNRHMFGLDPERSQLIPVTRNVGTNPMVPAKRQRILSGIYPLIPKDKSNINYEYVQNVGLRGRDGTIRKLNAVVQKRCVTPQIEVTVQDIINKSITQTLSNPYVNTETSTSLTFSNINPPDALKTEKYLNIHQRNVDQRNERFGNSANINDGTDNRNERYGNIDNGNERYGNIDDGNERYGSADQRNKRYTIITEDNENPYSVYYHKKIRGEQVRSQRSYQREISRDAEERLPKIDSVFSRFNVHTDFTQPIYVQVSNESERLQSHPQYTSLTSTTPLLEQLYNFRSGFLVNQPLQRISTTTSTNCVYSTPVIATAVAQPTTLAKDYNNIVCERDNYYSDLAGFPRICELLKFGEQENLRRDFRCDEELSTNSSFDDSASQDLGATVTIPEMVEDALELISQDGDYMERIGMDVRMQCVLCSYVCPKFLLEYHIRKEHSDEIQQQEHSSWSLSFPLRALRARRVAVLAHAAALAALAARCSGDCLHVTLHSFVSDTNLPMTGSITIYNKVTGEPYTWEGEIQTLPHDFAHNNNTDGLKVEVSKLDLLPNSANLKLLNGELVLKSPTKVVVGQPDLNDIHVILFVKIND